MVPWHLQPKYSAGEEGCHGEEASSTAQAKAEAKAARARAKKQEKKRRKGKEKGRITAGGEGGIPPGDVECVGVQDKHGGVQEQDSSELEREQSQTCERTAGTTSQQQQLAREGYTTYQRYYHVFRQGELVELFHKVPQLHIEEEFYDHENWCVLAEKL